MENDYDFYDHAPGNFALCLKMDCATSGECLRALAARDMETKGINICIINPLLTNPAGGKACAHFRKAERVRVAYGFRQALAKIEAGKVRDVRSAMLGVMCQRNYYYLLRGEKPMFPKMQKRVEEILKRNGLPMPIEFDRYEWHYEWNE